MTKREHLFYALGHLAYAVAMTDGKISQEEKEKLHKIVVKEVEAGDYDFNVSEIIFHILQKDGMKLMDCYDWAMKEIELVKQELTNDMRADFPAILEKVAYAFNGMDQEERTLIERFRKELGEI